MNVGSTGRPHFRCCYIPGEIMYTVARVIPANMPLHCSSGAAMIFRRQALNFQTSILINSKIGQERLLSLISKTASLWALPGMTVPVRGQSSRRWHAIPNSSQSFSVPSPAPPQLFRKALYHHDEYFILKNKGIERSSVLSFLNKNASIFLLK